MRLAKCEAGYFNYKNKGVGFGKSVCFRETPVYDATFNLLTNTQKQVLVAVAKAEDTDNIFSVDFLRKHDIKTSSTLDRTLKSLINKDIVDKAGREYSIVNIFFRKWLMRF